MNSIKWLYKIVSKILEKKLKTEIGLQLETNVLSPDLKIGTILAIFNSSGTIPVSNDLLIRYVRSLM